MIFTKDVLGASSQQPEPAGSPRKIQSDVIDDHENQGNHLQSKCVHFQFFPFSLNLASVISPYLITFLSQ